MNDALKQKQFEQDIDTRTLIFGTFKSGDEISVTLIQRRCAVSYFSASRVFENLIEDGLVEIINETYCKML